MAWCVLWQACWHVVAGVLWQAGVICNIEGTQPAGLKESYGMVRVVAGFLALP